MSVASVTGRKNRCPARQERGLFRRPLSACSRQVGTQFVAKLVRHGNDILRWQGPAGTPLSVKRRAWLRGCWRCATPFGKPQGVPPKRPSAGLGACHPNALRQVADHATQTLGLPGSSYKGSAAPEGPEAVFLSGFAGLFYFL